MNIIPMNKHELLAAIDKTAAEIEMLASPLSEAQMNTVPYPDSWTAAQLLRHLIKSENLMTGALRRPGRPADREIAQRAPELMAIFLDDSKRLSSPGIIIPEPGHYAKGTILAEWHEALARFDEAAAPAAEAELVENLPLGPITKMEIIHFVLYHTQRHLLQMKKITAAV